MSYQWQINIFANTHKPFLPDHSWFHVLITWTKAAFTRNNMQFPEWEPPPAFENLLQHSANALHFLIISTCLSNCSQLSTHLQYFETHLSGFDILSLTPRPQKSCWNVLATHHNLPKKKKQNVVLQTENSLQFWELWRIYRCPSKYNLLLNQQEGKVII